MKGVAIWTCASHHPAFRCGGWAYVRAGGGGVSGAAGGERDTTGARIARAGLAAALAGLPAYNTAVDPIAIHTADAELQALIQEVLGSPSAEPASIGVADLRSKLLVLARTGRLSLVRDPSPAPTDSPSAFVAAWAELARDKAKLGGAFTAPIPKSNLAKAPGLQARGLAQGSLTKG